MTALLAAGVLSATHMLVGRLPVLDTRPAIWKSVAGGIGISYAFLVLLPKLASAQSVLRAAADGGVYGFLEHHSYLVALGGLVLYYGLDIAAEDVLLRPEKRGWRALARLLVVVQATGFSGYFFLVGYLVGELPGWNPALLGLSVAMVVHFLAIDHGLRRKYGGLYDRVLRWVFMSATMAGALLATTTEIRITTLALLNSLFAGMLIIATMKEKVPSSRHALFWPFFAGAVGFAVLLALAGLF
jgi:hypothetical protein